MGNTSCMGRGFVLAFVAEIAMGCAAILHAQPAKEPVPRFVDITASTKIRFEHLSSPDAKYIVESMSGGVALLDYDGDGWLDIYFTNAPSVAMALAGKQARSALYRNNHDGTFTDVSEKAGVAYPCWAMGAAVADFNNDGWADLAVSCFGGVVLYRNNRDGTFANVTKSSGLDKDKGWATGVSFGDYNGDGLPDLFVPHYVDLDLQHLPAFGSQKTCMYHEVAVQCGPRGLKGAPDNLYRNNGDGTFTEVAREAGVEDANGFFGMQAVWSHFNGDDKLDLLVANDGEPNYLYRNDGKGHFTEMGHEAGVALSENGAEQANMGVAVGDFMRTGREAIAISHFSEDYFVLYRNEGEMNFSDVSHYANIAKATEPYVGWGDTFLDSDNRGLLDLMLVNGHVYPQVDSAKLGTTFREPMLLFWNNGDGTFREVSHETGPAMRMEQVSRGLAVGDLFNTGRLDVVVENVTGGPMILEAIANPKNHWISFRLEGSALNARVYLRTDAVQQMSEVHSGGSYLSQSDLRQHFGLGAAGKVDEVKIVWPDGRAQTFKDVLANSFYRVKEGETLVVEKYR